VNSVVLLLARSLLESNNKNMEDETIFNVDLTEEKPLDAFGEFIMKAMRDQAIFHYDMLAKGQYRTPGILKLQADLKGLPEEHQAVARRVVFDAIDCAIGNFLYYLEQQVDFENRISVLVDGVDVIAQSLEERSGLRFEIYEPDSWIERFSRYEYSPDGEEK
jgi:hypothetical protein